DQWFPEIWCERTTGKLYIHWYDDRANPSNFTTDIYATYTTNGGQSFVTSQRLTNQSFVFPNPPCSPGCYRNGTALNMGSYFPDFAMRVSPNAFGMNGINDSQFVYVTVPAVKLYSDTALFSATLVNLPGAGNITLDLLNKTTNTAQNRLLSYPDSLRLRIKTSGGVPNGGYTVRVVGNGPNGTPVHERFININVGFVGVVNENQPVEYSLGQNYPNPFNPSTKVNFSIVNSGFVNVSVYDISGKLISNLVNQNLKSGTYEYEWNAKDHPSGVYFYRITTPGFTDTKKMILVK
nr:T9SS type A sorting domain-containing protein [Ignavibacteria bacterium]